MASKKSTKSKTNLVYSLRDLVENVKSKAFSIYFINPVDEQKDCAPNYYTIIKNPMSLSTMLTKLRSNTYIYAREVLEDFQLISNNCREYNTDKNNIVRKKLEQFDPCYTNNWKKMADQLAPHGIDLNSIEIDYSEFDINHFDEKKMSKEQKALLGESAASIPAGKIQRSRKSNYAEDDQYDLGAPIGESSTKVKLNFSSLFGATEFSKKTSVQPENYYSESIPKLTPQVSAPGYFQQNQSASYGSQVSYEDTQFRSKAMNQYTAPPLQKTPSVQEPNWNRPPQTQSAYNYQTPTQNLSQSQSQIGSNFGQRPIQDFGMQRRDSSGSQNLQQTKPPVVQQQTYQNTMKFQDQNLDSQFQKTFQYNPPPLQSTPSFPESSPFAENKIDSLLEGTEVQNLNLESIYSGSSPQKYVELNKPIEEKKPAPYVKPAEPPRKPETVFERPKADAAKGPSQIKINLSTTADTLESKKAEPQAPINIVPSISKAEKIANIVNQKPKADFPKQVVTSDMAFERPKVEVPKNGTSIKISMRPESEKEQIKTAESTPFIPSKVESDKSVESIQTPQKPKSEFSLKLKLGVAGAGDKITIQAPEENPFAFNDYDYEGLLQGIGKNQSDQHALKAEEPAVVEEPQVVQPPYSPWESKILINREEVQAKFKEFATSKFPKYLRKFKKHLKRVSKWLENNNVTEPNLLKLKDEAENLIYEDRSPAYSRALLYLYKVLIFAKNNFLMDKVTQKGYRSISNAVDKCFNYLREIINLNYIQFNEEETKIFDQERRQFRGSLKKQLDEFDNQRIQAEQGIDYEALAPPPFARRDVGGVTKIRIHSKLIGPMPKKKGEMEAENQEQEFCRKLLSEQSKNLIYRKKIPEWEALVRHSWGSAAQEKMAIEEEKAVEKKSQPIKLMPVESRDVMAEENDEVFPMSSTHFSLQLALKKQERQKIKPLSIFKEDIPQQRMEYNQTKQLNFQNFPYEPLKEEDIFKIHIKPHYLHLEGSFPLRSQGMNLGLPFEVSMKQFTFLYRNEEKYNICREKGIEYKLRTLQSDFQTIKYIVMARVGIKFVQDGMTTGDQVRNENSELMVTVRNEVSSESLHSLIDIQREILRSEVKLKDYESILKSSKKLSLIDEINAMKSIMSMIKENNFILREDLGMYYIYKEEKGVIVLTFFTVIEELNKFHISIGNKDVL